MNYSAFNNIIFSDVFTFKILSPFYKCHLITNFFFYFVFPITNATNIRSSTYKSELIKLEYASESNLFLNTDSLGPENPSY